MGDLLKYSGMLHLELTVASPISSQVETQLASSTLRTLQRIVMMFGMVRNSSSMSSG